MTMYQIRLICITLWLFALTSCSEEVSTPETSAIENTKKIVIDDAVKINKKNTSEPETKKVATNNERTSATTTPNIYQEQLLKKIAYGKATLAEVRQALTNNNASMLTNTMHALYSMRQHRGVRNLILGLWELDKEKYPELSWEQISTPPAKIALASTINRMLIVGTDEYKDYIRSFKDDEHEFHRAQVVVSLGFNGSPDDIEYIKSMANAENHYVAQSAITALAIMGGNQARDALLELHDSHEGTPRGGLVETLLIQTYDWEPNTEEIKVEENRG